MASIPVNFVIIISIIAILLYLLGIHNFLTRVEENACEMTYMFEYPQYVELSLPPDVQKKHSRYSLYGYSEGSKTEELRRMKFNGVPVLYIPGSGGSHKQGRSIASLALRKALNSRTPFHFDFFLVDFSEDLSGIYGGVLDDQTTFVIACIEKILSLYSRENIQFPTSVVLIAHSAGGLVAKGVFTNPQFNPQLVQMIITLASPLAAPIIQPDPYLADYYKKLSEVWTKRIGNVSHVTLVSLGGGARDIVVRSDLIKDPDADVNVLATAVPGVWCSTDHLSITWCKQLVMTIVRTLFDSVDLQTKQITDDVDYRRAIFEYHFIKRSAGKKFTPHPKRGGFERNGRWVENLQRQFSVVEKKGLKTPQFLMLRLLDDPKHEVAVLETINLNVKDWVYVCVADLIINDLRVCDEGENLSNLTEIIPAAPKMRRKLIRLDMKYLKEKGFSHVVVRIPPASVYVQVNVDIHRQSDRVVSHPVPRVSALSSSVIMESSADNAVHYKVELPGFDQIWQAFSVNLEAVTCRTATNHAILTFSVPWANETESFLMANQKEAFVTLKLTSTRSVKDNGTAMLDLVLDPSCKYKLSISPNKLAVAGQIARYYSVLLPGYLIAVIIMVLRRQLESLDSGSGVPLFHNALAQSVRKYYVLLQAAIIGSKVIGSRFFSFLLPLPDPLTLQESNMDFFFLPILLFAVATAVVYIAGAVVYCAIVISGQAAHKLAFRFLARTVTGFVSWSEWVISALHQLPFVAATLLISLSYATAGGLALSLAAAFYFLKLCKLYEDYLEDLFKISMKFVARTIKSVVGSRNKSKGEPAVSSSEEPTARPDDDVKLEKEDKSNVEENEEKEKKVTEESILPDTSVGTSEVNTGVPEDAIAAVPEISQEEPQLSTLEEIHFHSTLCLLYVVTASMAVPSVLAWSRSFHQSTQLLRDPVWLPSIVFCGAGCILWQSGVPLANGRLTRISSSVLFMTAVCCIMFGSVSLYRLPYFASAAVFYVVVHQVSARFF